MIYAKKFAYIKKKMYFCSMKEKIIRTLVWLGVMAGLSLVTVILLFVFYGKSYLSGNPTLESMKWIQFYTVVGTLLLPPFICGFLWDPHRNPFQWLKLGQGAHWSYFLLAVGIMLFALPGINLLADINSRIPLPDSLIQKEADAAALIEQFLHADNIYTVLINFGLIALLPAFAEELTFRGTLQQILEGERSKDGRQGVQVHIAIWAAAIIFSAIHMQFLGFIPRMLMGAMFGYIFVWTGSLWLPMLMHFTNNSMVIIMYYALGSVGGAEAESYKNYADTFGAGTTWWVGVLSLIITFLGLLIFYRRTHKQ